MMKFAKLLALMMVMCALTFAAAYAQEGDKSQDKTAGGAAMPATAGEAVAVAEATKAAISQPKDQTIYGEVQAVNAPSSTMTVQFYDYDTDEEKSIELSVAGDTKIENAPGLGSIKKGDWADITYMTQNSKNMAKSIIVEKEEEVPAETAPEGETKE